MAPTTCQSIPKRNAFVGQLHYETFQKTVPGRAPHVWNLANDCKVTAVLLPQLTTANSRFSEEDKTFLNDSCGRIAVR
jgi:hypothetical protein